MMMMFVSKMKSSSLKTDLILEKMLMEEKNFLASWAVILKHETENERLVANLSDDGSVATAAGIRIGREDEGADSTNSVSTMDPTKATPIQAGNNFLGQLIF